MNIIQVPIKELVLADYNPRNITEKQVEDLKQSIQRFGVVEPVVVNSNPERKNIIVGGHQRVRIMQMLGFENVPVHYVNLELEKERELNLRLNKNTGSWDWEKLANEFDVEQLQEVGFTLGELGMDNGIENIDTDNLGDALDSYLDGNIRQIVLYFKKEEYEQTLKRMEAVMADFGIDSDHTETFLKLLEHYENTRTQEQKP